MVSASQIADRIPELPDLPVDVGEMTDRLRGLTEAAATTAREAANSARQAAGGRPSDKRGLTLPLLAGLGALGVLIAVVLMLRSRRTTTDVGSTAPTGTPAHT